MTYHVQPAPARCYLTTRPGAGGSLRFYFQPPSRFVKDGWPAVRLHDAFGQPIKDEARALEHAAPLADIFQHWLAQVPDYGPHMIDKLGRVTTPAVKVVRKLGAKTVRPPMRYLPGQIGAMVGDFLNSPFVTSKKAKTRAEYRTYLSVFCDEFGTHRWPQLSSAQLRRWLMERGEQGGEAGMHSCYRTIRVFFNRMRLIYERKDHPGYVPKHENPAQSLALPQPKPLLLPWPREAVRAFVELADSEGEPSIGDAIVTMAWLGVRRQDWLQWPADVFDRPLLRFQQEKTSVPNLLPWDIVPELVTRVAAARQRRQHQGVASTRFFVDRQGRPWSNPRAFWKAFNRLRDLLAKKHPSFATRYWVGLLEDPLAIPTTALTTRTLRHTCVTFLFDARVPSDQIRGITGHTTREIDAILAHYRARTAEQAEAALRLRLDHEAKLFGRGQD